MFKIYIASISYLLVTVFTFPAAFAIPPSCTELTGLWKGSYVEDTGIYGSPGPWPTEFKLIYNSTTHIFIGHINNQFVPNAVTQSGKIIMENHVTASIIGVCHQGIIKTLLLQNPNLHCGNYNHHAGKFINDKSLILIITSTQTGMNMLKFTVLLHKLSNQYTGPSVTQNDFKLPQVKSCL